MDDEVELLKRYIGAAKQAEEAAGVVAPDGTLVNFYSSLRETAEARLSEIENGTTEV